MPPSRGTPFGDEKWTLSTAHRLHPSTEGPAKEKCFQKWYLTPLVLPKGYLAVPWLTKQFKLTDPGQVYPPAPPEDGK